VHFLNRLFGSNRFKSYYFLKQFICSTELKSAKPKKLTLQGANKKNYRGKTKLTHITGDINLFSSYFTQSSTSDRTSKPLNPLNLKS
jgi:hypothetical protein